MRLSERKVKFNVIIPETAKTKIDKFWNENAFRNRNEFILKAIDNYIKFLENEKLKRDLERGYQENARAALQDIKEWEKIDFETWPE